ncbi:MAG TPA: lyase family protein [Solirubrobacter sp.]|nr:lyase family protein [Solirubrobacter sp.]
MRPSSSSSDVFAGVLARGGVAARVDGAAWVRALLDFELALARVQTRHGVLSAEQLAEIEAACTVELDAAAIGVEAAAIGNPAGAVVAALRAVTDAPVHHGATSQDAVDTAAMLVTKRALGPLLGDLRGAANAAAALAAEHRATPIMGRTLLQRAKPTTFGLKAAGWMLALDEAADALGRVPLAAQLGGPVGTLGEIAVAPRDGAGDAATALAIAADLARELGLDAPLLPWHTLRGRIGELAGALGVAAGAVGKAARDITLLAQTEVGEVQEARGGGSTSMPHKHNPIAAVSALGCALQAPGLVATLLAAQIQEHERAAGAWHSEWRPLTELLIATGSAAAWLRASLDGLDVDADRMRVDGDTGAATALVDRALEHR